MKKRIFAVFLNLIAVTVLLTLAGLASSSTELLDSTEPAIPIDPSDPGISIVKICEVTYDLGEYADCADPLTDRRYKEGSTVTAKPPTFHTEPEKQFIEWKVITEESVFNIAAGDSFTIEDDTLFYAIYADTDPQPMKIVGCSPRKVGSALIELVLDISDEVFLSDKISYTISGQVKYNSGMLKHLGRSEMEIDGVLDEYTILPIKCAIPQLTDEFTIEWKNFDKVIATQTVKPIYLLKQYAENKTELEYIESLLYYCGYAQRALDHNTEVYADQYTSIDLSESTELNTALEAHEKTVSGEVSGIEYLGSSLILEDCVGIRHYFKLAEGENIEDYSFLHNDDDVNVPSAKSGVYYVCNNDIYHYLYDIQNLFTVRKGDECLSISYSVLDYCKELIKQYSDNDDLVILARAIYNYHLAVQEYFG